MREAKRNGEVTFVHCNSKVQLAKILTNALVKNRFETLRDLFSVLSKSAKEDC